MDKTLIVEHYAGQAYVVICKEVNSGGDMKTITFPVEELEGLIARLQEVRYTVQSYQLNKDRNDRLDRLG